MATTSHHKALAKFLKVLPEELNRIGGVINSPTQFELGNGSRQYYIATDSEANDVLREKIRDEVWAFNSDFILSQCGLPLELAGCIKGFQEKEGEGANDALLALVEKCGDLDKFVRDAVALDGRGHFLSSYDGRESEIDFEGETYYIYKN